MVQFLLTTLRHPDNLCNHVRDLPLNHWTRSAVYRLAMSRLKAEGVVPAPPSEVYALVSDPATWMRATQPTVEVLSDEQMPDGTRQVSAGTPLSDGSTINSTIVVLESVENERVVTHTASGPFPLLVIRYGKFNTDRTVTLEPHPGGTLVRSDSHWRFKPAPLGALFEVFLGKRWKESAESGIHALTAHFEAEQEGELEVECAYEWTQADARAIRRRLLWSTSTARLWIFAFLLSIVLGAAVEQAFWVFSIWIGAGLLFRAVRLVIRRQPLRSESTVVLGIGEAGVRFTTVEGDSEERTVLGWRDLRRIGQSPEYLLFVSRQPGVAGRYVPRRALESIPNGLARLKRLAQRNGVSA